MEHVRLVTELRGNGNVTGESNDRLLTELEMDTACFYDPWEEMHHSMLAEVATAQEAKTAAAKDVEIAGLRAKGQALADAAQRVTNMEQDDPWGGDEPLRDLAAALADWTIPSSPEASQSSPEAPI